MAQQAGRSAAAASRYVGSKIDWSRLLKLSGSNTTTVSNLQAKWSQAAVKMNSLSDSLPKIDFDNYRKMVADPTLVDKLQKEYENAQIAYPKDTANRFKELEEYAKSEEKRAQEFIKLAEGEVETLRKEFDRWDNVPPADEVTYELASFYMPEAVYPRVWDKDEHDKLKDIQFLPYEKRDSLRWWIEQGGELLPHKHEWVLPDEALDPIGAPPRPKKALTDHEHGHGHGDFTESVVTRTVSDSIKTRIGNKDYQADAIKAEIASIDVIRKAHVETNAMVEADKSEHLCNQARACFRSQ